MRFAVDTAKRHLLELYSDCPLEGLLLEEVERSEDDAAWLITLGFDLPPDSSAFSLRKPARHYKRFRIGDSAGEVEWMRIREVHVA